MSRAFVKETDGGAIELPDRPISPHRNLVTEAGLAAIEAALHHFELAHRVAVAMALVKVLSPLRESFVTGELVAPAPRSSSPRKTKARPPSE